MFNAMHEEVGICCRWPERKLSQRTEARRPYHSFTDPDCVVVLCHGEDPA